MLFSATSTEKTDDLTQLALKKEPIFVGVDEQSSDSAATVEGLEQGYVVCPAEKRFLLLFSFLKRNRKKKIMVFFSSCMSVKYHHELLNYIDVPVMCIHGKQKQTKRTTTFFQFCNAESGTLLCTDVAARGLDIPAVDWIVQFDPTDDPKVDLCLVYSGSSCTNVNISTGIHPPGWPNCPRSRRQGPRTADPAPGRAGLPALPKTGQSATQRVRVLMEQDRRHTATARDAHFEELLPAHVGQRRVQGFRARLRLAPAEDHLRYSDLGLGQTGYQLRIQSATERGPE